jgi:hypothetical protein
MVELRIEFSQGFQVENIRPGIRAIEPKNENAVFERF